MTKKPNVPLDPNLVPAKWTGGIDLDYCSGPSPPRLKWEPGNHPLGPGFLVPKRRTICDTFCAISFMPIH